MSLLRAKFSKINNKKVALDTLQKIWKTGSTDQRHETGTLKHARTEENVITVDEQISLLNHESQKQAYRSTRQMSIKMGLIQCT